MEVKDTRMDMLKNWDVKKVLITLAIPSIVGMLVNGIYNIVDTIFVGRIGTSALGAVSVVFPFFMIIAALGISTGVGSASAISRAMGAGEKEEGENILATGILIGLMASILVIVFGSIYLEEILVLFGANETILYYAMDYAMVLVIGSPIVIVKMVLNNCMRAEGSAKASMVVLITGAVLNIILDPILIFTFNMGIRGAAVATVFSQFVALLLQVYYYSFGKSYLKINIKSYRFKVENLYKIASIGFPMFFTQGLNSVAMAFVNNTAALYGDYAVASMGTVSRVMSLGIFAIIGYSQGFQPLAGFSYGARRYDRLWEAIKFSVKITSIFAILISVSFFYFSEQVISLFSNDVQVLEFGSRALKAYSIPFGLLGFQLVYFSLFQALGKAIPATILSVARQGLLLIPLIKILPNYIGSTGVILAQPIADILTIFMTLVFAVFVNKDIRSRIEEMEARKIGEVCENIN